MATRFIDKHADSANLEVTPTAIGIGYDPDDDVLKFADDDGSTIRSVVSADQTQTLTNKTLTSPTITGATITAPVGTVASEIVTATNVITAAESGTTFFLNSATEFDSTLPLPAQGLFYRFIVTDAPETASYTITTNGAAQILAGQVFGSDGGDGDSETTPTATTITFVDGASVVGDMAEVWSDGTSWFARCFCNVATTGITITG